MVVFESSELLLLCSRLHHGRRAGTGLSAQPGVRDLRDSGMLGAGTWNGGGDRIMSRDNQWVVALHRAMTRQHLSLPVCQETDARQVCGCHLKPSSQAFPDALIPEIGEGPQLLRLSRRLPPTAVTGCSNCKHPSPYRRQAPPVGGRHLLTLNSNRHSSPRVRVGNSLLSIRNPITTTIKTFHGDGRFLRPETVTAPPAPVAATVPDSFA